MAELWTALLSMKLVHSLVGSTEHRFWITGLQDISDNEIRHGLKKCLSFTGFFNLPSFRELCKMSAEDLGLPEAHKAYVEAAMSDGQRDRVKWSHPAVYHAGRETGWFELRNFTEREIYPKFKYNYAKMCERVLNGEVLDTPVQIALPASVPRYLNKAQNLERLGKIKQLLED